ncbi:MAG: 3-hydroxyacyl-CoA dehydrogenase NAD-binding domain-containing protein [Hydrogenophaga sp.]|uniref:3-hydroxyacyl-CoA dehydrogenase NAD-binding domain-containing protein n=1 Tax=Hydrogenophaga sp. TaxID=1904254 RepID=UPI002ABBF0B9|nr:3-hydroxyacyl-CoA dehydrogenase NAD-binding domain-containing protein [Hydrogenophaga sp.]MDZ4173111.1 3-hydroxyacyl-CoA dehydrogenase NAD-binding domain-containing protein [Hydrogenophaga sp.]
MTQPPLTALRVARVELNAPPVNSLGITLRKHIVESIRSAESDPEVAAIVLIGTDKAFSAGADVAEFGTPTQFEAPMLRDVIATIEGCQKPVVAAISGVALGGGLELALGCHARVALASARLGTPEIQLGLIPGSGATQKLLRLMGADRALAMMISGQAQTAEQLSDSGLLDLVVPQDLWAVTSALALELAQQPLPLPRACDRTVDVAAVDAAVEKASARLNKRQRAQPAYLALMDAVRASARPFDAGMQRERDLFLSLMQSSEAAALRYQFRVQRESAKLPANLSAAPRAFDHVAVIGAGTMGTGIAIAALEAGLQVSLLEQSAEALERGSARIAEHFASRVKAGKTDAARAERLLGRLTATLDWPSLQAADVVIEAVFEDLAVKQSVFRLIDQHARVGAVLATNTSYLDIDAIAAVVSRPQDVLGLHFFSPANVMKLLEVVQGKDSAPDAMATAMALGKHLKKIPILCGNAFGFIGNRIYNAYRKQCEFMLEDGAWPEDVDQALTDFGFAMGPFAVADLSGLDIAWRMRQANAATRDPRERYVHILDRLCEIGRMGRKTQAGYYTYTDGKPSPTTDDVVRGIIERAGVERGIKRSPLSAEVIQRRALLAMVNEAALLFAEGVAHRAGDIDVVLVNGYGFPAWVGGPVHWARTQPRSRLELELDQLTAASGFGAVRATPAMLNRLLD